jgi:hypothetical protein
MIKRRYFTDRILGKVDNSVDNPVRPDVEVEGGDWYSVEWGEGYSNCRVEVNFTGEEKVKRFEEKHRGKVQTL